MKFTHSCGLTVKRLIGRSLIVSRFLVIFLLISYTQVRGTGYTHTLTHDSKSVDLLGENELSKDTLVKGTVVDKISGEPISGVSIQVKENNKGTSTDSKGNFSIDVSEKAILDRKSVV